MWHKCGRWIQLSEMSLLADHLSKVIGTTCSVFCQEGQIKIDKEVEGMV
jgi:hypothetical protein